MLGKPRPNVVKVRELIVLKKQHRSEKYIELSKEMDRLVNLIFPEGNNYGTHTKIDKAKLCGSQLRLLLKRVEDTDMPKADKENLKLLIDIKIINYKKMENEK